MPDLTEKFKGIVVWMSREITQACCPEYFPGTLPSGKSYHRLDRNIHTKTYLRNK